jgi:universal stress protein E
MTRTWKRIAVAIRDTDARSSAALGKVMEIARHGTTRVHVFHVYSPAAGLFQIFDPRTAELIARSSIEQHRKSLERLVRPLRRKGFDVETEVTWDYPPHEGMVRQVLKQDADLLVVDAHRHSRLARWFLTNTDWELIRHCPCPLWFVKSARFRPKPRILAAVDPFHAGARPARLDDGIVRVAGEVADHGGGKVALCHADTPPLPYIAAPAPAPVPWSPELARLHSQAVRKGIGQLARRHGLPSSAVHIETGDPATVLPRMARRLRGDVVVMGAVSRSGLDRLLIGSTAERVIDDLPCDVLFVKPHGFRAKVPRGKRQAGRAAA